MVIQNLGLDFFRVLQLLLRVSFFGSQLLLRGEGVLDHRINPPRSIGRGSILRE
jgi:hypothetical protein